MSIQQCYLIFTVVLFSLLSANPIEPELSLTQEPGTSGEQGEVIFVNVLYRHGDRTPVDPYTTDPYKDLKYWPVGWGQLTTSGMHRQYELGKWMRNRYRNILVNDYTKDDIYILSTDVDRTLMSAQSHLAGMYPPSPNHTFQANLPWQPIAIHTVPETEDGTLGMKKLCPRYENELEKVKTTNPDLVDFTNRFQDVFAYLTEHTGDHVADIRHAEYIHGNLFVEEANNFTLPEWTKKVYPEPLRTIARMSFVIPTFTQTLSRLKAGPILKHMLANLQSKVKNEMKPDRKMFMYSAHDTTVANILNSLKIADPDLPPYAATILMELRKNGDKHFVAMFYKNTTAEPTLLTLPGCTQYCPLEKFASLLEPLLPDEWEKECSNSYDLLTWRDTVAMLSGALIVLVIGICFLIFINLKRITDGYNRYQSVSTNIN